MEPHDHNNRALPIYRGTIRAPRKRLLKNPDHVHRRAKAVAELEMSGEDTVDHCFEQILCGFEGMLIDYNGYEIDLGTWVLDDLWGEDAGRTMNRYKRFASEKPKQRLHERLVEREMATDFAIQIYLRRKALAGL